MITAQFAFRNGDIAGFFIKGHAEWAEPGEDICCASVSSAVQLAVNAVLEIEKVPAQLEVLENEISVTFPENQSCDFANKIFEALRIHLEILAEDFAGTIKVIISEV